jgi:hypothetical protein
MFCADVFDSVVRFFLLVSFKIAVSVCSDIGEIAAVCF